MDHRVFIAGGTGYVGSALLPKLTSDGHQVVALARATSRSKIKCDCTVVSGEALDHRTYVDGVRGCDTFVHLVGTPHPAPWKGAQFQSVDLGALRESVRAAAQAGVRHFVFLSVAHPAPVMKAYIEVRQKCERMIADAGLAATIVRPWYILGPGHWWPIAIKPVYALMQAIPSTRESARRLGLVTLDQMVQTLRWAVENPPSATRVIDVPGIIRTASESKAVGVGAV